MPAKAHPVEAVPSVDPSQDIPMLEWKAFSAKRTCIEIKARFKVPGPAFSWATKL